MADGFTCLPPYALTPGRPPPGTSCPPASLHRLAYYPLGPSPALIPKESGRDLSIRDLSLDGLTRVREYQPVIHRLRLSASP